MSDAPPAATIVIRTHHELTIFRAMLDKHEKGTNATINTVESFGGGRESLDDVLAHLALWKRQAALQHELLAPKGNDAAKGTPIGDAIARADETGVEGVRWGNIAPHPRPNVGALIRWPGGTTTSVVTPIGFRHPELKGDEQSVPLDLAARLLDEGAFEVSDSEGWTGPVQSHVDDAGAVEWRVVHSDGHTVYDTPRRVPPTTLADAVEQVASGTSADAGSGEDVLDDYATGTSQDAEGAAPATKPVSKRAAKKAASHPGPVAEGVKGKSQRERNAHAAGVTRPAPKPTTKRAGRKGGR